MRSKFDRVMDFVLRWEGGYANDPRDPGGETKYGISKRSHPELDIKNLTKEQALEIYREEYWDPINGDTHPYIEALVLMDFAVHSGVQTSLTFWQNATDVRDFLLLRSDYLRVIRDGEGNLLFPTYGRGWMARINALHREINREEKTPDVELLQIYYNARVIEFEPVKVTVGQTNAGRTKIMVRI